MRKTSWRWKALLGGFAVLVPSLVLAAGFALPEQGSRSMGMAGAFTATSDDLSAMYHNPAGLAFQTNTEAYLGPTLILPKSEFEGDDPFPGVGIEEEQKTQVFTPISMYLGTGLSENWRVGFAVMTPFGLATEWEHPDTYSGRFISQRADLKVISLQPTIAWKVSEHLGLGLGIEYRYSAVELERNVPLVNPFTQSAVDIAHIDLESTGVNADWGFSAGLLYRFNEAFRIGVSYRHHIDIDYDGEGRFTQISTGNPELDAVVASQLPFDEDLDVETGISFPSQASLGIAIDATPDTTFEVDANWTGWNSFESVDIAFVDHPELSSSIDEGWKNVWNFRAGFEKRLASGNAVRVGYVYDVSPQPREGIGPLLPDRDRAGYSFGYGGGGAKWGYDIAYMYLTFRNIGTRGENADHYDGTYENSAHLLGLHLRYRF